MEYFIYILPSIADGALKHSVVQTIESSGHIIGKAGELQTADLVIGLLEDPNWQLVADPKKRIILKESSRVDTVPSEAILVDALLLTMIDKPTLTLCDWLKTK